MITVPDPPRAVRTMSTGEINRRWREAENRADELAGQLQLQLSINRRLQKKLAGLTEPVEWKWGTRKNGQVLTVRVRKILQLLNVRTLEDLATYHPKEMAVMRNCGTTTMEEMRDLLAEHGLEFAPVPPSYVSRTRPMPRPGRGMFG